MAKVKVKKAVESRKCDVRLLMPKHVFGSRTSTKNDSAKRLNMERCGSAVT
jgi:hypothetical protein